VIKNHLIDIEISLFFCSSSKTHLMDLIARPASKQKKLLSTNLGQSESMKNKCSFQYTISFDEMAIVKITLKKSLIFDQVGALKRYLNKQNSTNVPYDEIILNPINNIASYH
jgi:hypothetical protein